MINKSDIFLCLFWRILFLFVIYEKRFLGFEYLYSLLTREGQRQKIHKRNNFFFIQLAIVINYLTVSLRVLCAWIAYTHVDTKAIRFMRCSLHWDRTNSITFISAYGCLKFQKYIVLFTVLLTCVRSAKRACLFVCVHVFLDGSHAWLQHAQCTHISNVRWAKGSLNNWMHWEYTTIDVNRGWCVEKEQSIIKKWLSD